MPNPSRKPTRRPPDDDPGYEVVEDAPPRRARVVKADPVDDPGFEVVEDEPPPVKKKRPVVAVDEDDDDDRPVNRSRRDEDDEEPAVPRKKKRKRPRFEDDDVKPSTVAWWIVPCFLIGLGIAFSIAGAVGISSKAKVPSEAIGVGVILGVTLVQFVVSIPISIIALVIGGKLFGIEYGSPLMAIVNIAAIGSMMMGLDWLLTWIGLWHSAIFAITVIVAISLFMTLFQLDTWEVIVSIICIKAVTFLSYIAVFVLVLAAVMRGGGDGGSNFDDDPDDLPQIKQKQKMDGNKNPAGNRGRGDPDWDPDDD